MEYASIFASIILNVVALKFTIYLDTQSYLSIGLSACKLKHVCFMCVCIRMQLVMVTDLVYSYIYIYLSNLQTCVILFTESGCRKSQWTF